MGQREKLSCDIVTTEASAHPTGSSGVRVALQSRPALRQEDQAFMLLHVSVIGCGPSLPWDMSLGEDVNSSEGNSWRKTQRALNTPGGWGMEDLRPEEGSITALWGLQSRMNNHSPLVGCEMNLMGSVQQQQKRRKKGRNK